MAPQLTSLSSLLYSRCLCPGVCKSGSLSLSLGLNLSLVLVLALGFRHSVYISFCVPALSSFSQMLFIPVPAVISLLLLFEWLCATTTTPSSSSSSSSSEQQLPILLERERGRGIPIPITIPVRFPPAHYTNFISLSQHPTRFVRKSETNVIKNTKFRITGMVTGFWNELELEMDTRASSFGEAPQVSTISFISCCRIC